MWAWAAARLGAIAVIAAGVALVAPAAAGASGGTKLYVNTSGTDTGNCPFQAPCATIGYALGQAVNGSKIEVASGTYNEQLVVNKSVSIIGSAARRTRP